MSHLVAVSPHLDDAAFSAGGLLAAHARAGGRVTIVTCFTGNVARPSGFALACQLDKGLAPDVDYMALRRAEDSAACAVIGAEPVHLPFLEAPHRGYASARDLFGPRRADDTMVDQLAPALATLLDRLAPDLLLGPLALGDHVDHWVVRDALARGGRAVLLWEDWPYLDRPGVVAGEPRCRVALDDELRARRIAMCGAYPTQLGFQFGGHAAMAARIDSITEERFHDPAG
ncbi:PIG-L deacetylase family protein [Sphingomonas bacterium]|uniref:PIG-L deacetylase family protein n=1 Tax=Sphingomonas bacterium TaxID=1895847 RepID=UPI0015753995|nr:PIG-L family deacetylase [Sphingomonas bacterium]